VEASFVLDLFSYFFVSRQKSTMQNACDELCYLLRSIR
jgi:hypothetical protein